jgi:hypothetical protein
MGNKVLSAKSAFSPALAGGARVSVPYGFCAAGKFQVELFCAVIGWKTQYDTAQKG